MWFEAITGFRETSPYHVRENLTLEGQTVRSRINGKKVTCGLLETPSLAELRERVGPHRPDGGKLSVREVVADVQSLHTDDSNAGALFQVASQFNLLEMASPDVTPEAGIDIYENDHTQGPACAIAAGGGTIFRNYFAPVNQQIGQSASNQIDCLADVGAALGNTENRLWTMKNGYALASYDGLIEISNRLQTASESELDALRGLLRIGIQWNTQVTLGDCGHLVSQAYCSALPVAYGAHSAELWAPFAKLILDAAYEATILAAILNSRDTGSNRCYLTLLGGGVFGNATQWIIDAIERALTLYADVELDVAIVSHRASEPSVRQIVERLSG